MSGGGGSSQSTKSETTQADNRVVLGNDAVQVGAFGSYTRDSGNTSRTDLQVNDSSSHDTNYIGTDGGAVQIAKFNADLLKSVSENQGDTVKVLAAMGSDGISKQAESATDLFKTSSAASSAAWGHTIDKSAELIDSLLQTAQGTIAGANAVATKAVDSFTPTANKQADAFKYAAIAAAALIALKVFKV